MAKQLYSLIAVTVLVSIDTVAAAQELVTVDQLAKATWKRVKGPGDKGSVVGPGEPGGWRSACVGFPTVEFDGETYRMWFVGAQETDDPRAPYGYYERIGLATSPDGLNWTVANYDQPVLDLGSKGSVDAKGVSHPFVLRDGGVYRMWYGGYSGSHLHHKVGSAESRDGVNWTRTNDGKHSTGLAGDTDQQLGLSVYSDGQEYYMIYSRSHFPGRGANLWVISAATSENGFHWKSVRNDRPLLGFPAPKGNFDAAEGRRSNNHSCHPTKIIIKDGRARVWYMGESNTNGTPPTVQHIGLMEAEL